MTPMIRSGLTVLACLFTLLAASGCSELNGTRLEPVLGGDVNLVELGDKVADTLISQTLPPLIAQQADQPILVTTLVNNDKLNDTSSFGRSFQNNIAAGFVSRGFAVKEIKLRRDLLVELHKGEFMLTRNLPEMAGAQRAQAVVVGTYTLTNRVMYLSVRLVSTANQSIRSVYEDKLYLDDNSLRLLGFKYANGSDGDEMVRPPSPSVLDSILY
ncbi:FlgO family outer membrane protein [Desulfobulbus sp.]|uniref:FlgO family outer membrane protein n=1 Tax=Desulfobulbus sp. TaxID=895 RepID=UPI0027BAC034|nr:FlgO family outer membrane protein [Desulfobulbus sp.]